MISVYESKNDKSIINKDIDTIIRDYSGENRYQLNYKKVIQEFHSKFHLFKINSRILDYESFLGATVFDCAIKNFITNKYLFDNNDRFIKVPTKYYFSLPITYDILYYY